MLVIALTGGIGSGKTTVSEIFNSKHIPVIDTDIIARQIVEQGKPAYSEIVKIFGEAILNPDKNINRQTLRQIIFSSVKKRLQLENILHPAIWNDVDSQLRLLTTPSSTPPAYCIVVVPLLLENTTNSHTVTFDRVLVIDVPVEIQIKRSTKRDNCDDSMIKDIIKNQVSRQVRLDAADDVLVNTGSLKTLNKKIEQLHQQYLQLSE